MQTLFRQFAVQDVTWDVLVQQAQRDAQSATPANPKFVPKMPKAAWAQRWIATAPKPLQRLIIPVLPNFNWLLFKRAAHDKS